MNQIMEQELKILLQENENLAKQVRQYADKIKSHQLFIRELADIIAVHRDKIKELDLLAQKITEHLR